MNLDSHLECLYPEKSFARKGIDLGVLGLARNRAQGGWV